ncbi:hypothetical protein FS827_02750 [Agrobacterium vitis]|uniref:diacylglycerol/lipid kinase family protein n=1 Tax=Allorhizobium ampelinum TaxID=3025782 RepID=UPI001F2A1592|nr:diacylglycerol kinase family protein [Allorhizobium ampelinum]MCF1460230.1 hypothetical protein [Allorhizobium ampelinum]
MRVTVIRNPVAGGAHAWPGTARALAEIFPGYSLVETVKGMTGPQARAAVTPETDLVLVVGGDGTVGQAVDGLLTSLYPQTAFAFLPGGTGADFSRNFDWPATTERQLQAIATAAPRRIDVGVLQSHVSGGEAQTTHFINVASTGVSGEIVAAIEANRGPSRLPAFLRYRLMSLARIARYKGAALRISVDGRCVYDGAVLVAAVTNGSWFGAGVRAAPQALLDDGQLDLVFARHCGAIGNLKIFAAFANGSAANSSAIETHRGQVIDIEPHGKIPMAEADGEVIRPGALRFSILPQALTVRLPPAVAPG